MATKKKIEPETVEKDVTEVADETGKHGTETGASDAAVADSVGAGKKHAAKAAQIAKNYGVDKVWGTADGFYWATSLEKMEKLPKNRGAIEVYDFLET